MARFSGLILIGMLVLAGCSWHRPSATVIEAAEAGDTGSLERALDGGEDANQKDGRGLTALIISARGGSTSAIQVLLRHHADPNLRGGVNAWTPLMHAVHKNHADAARALLDGGARVDDRGRSGETALMMAAGYGYTPIVELLLDRGADPHAVAADGANVLSIALSGVPDIEHFTLGSCQNETVHVLKRRYPDLHLPDNLWARLAQVAGGVAKLRGCGY